MISPRLKVEASYLLTVVVEDKKNNPSVGRTINLIVQTPVSTAVRYRGGRGTFSR